jgi:hypothetical protein
MSNIEQGLSKELSKREALNQALGCAIGKVAHPLSGEKAEQLQSTLTRPITADDAKAAGMATLHTAKDLPFTIMKEPIFGSRDLIRAIGHLFKKETTDAANQARKGVKEILAPVLWPITIAPRHLQENFDYEKRGGHKWLARRLGLIQKKEGELRLIQQELDGIEME